MKYQKIRVKKEFALGIAAASSDKGFFNLVGDIAESPTSTKWLRYETILSRERPKEKKNQLTIYNICFYLVCLQFEFCKIVFFLFESISLFF
jgi:hypothetical protein